VASFFNIANFISVFRAFLAIPLWFSVSAINANSSSEDIFWFLSLCLLIAITDLCDGYFARLFSTVTDLGKFLDPIADKICVFVFIVQLSFKFSQFLPLFICLLIRDIFVAVISIYFANQKKIFLQANIAGKWFLFFIGMTMLFFVIDIPESITINQTIKSLFFITSWIFFVLSTFKYFFDYIKHWRGFNV